PTRATNPVVDRARAALVGLAVGDALGAPVAFDAPEAMVGRRHDVVALPGGGSLGWAPGEVTDGTQTALGGGRHVRDHGGHVDQDALVHAFARWAQDAADVGTQTRRVLGPVSRGEAWRRAVEGLPLGAAGNGSLMRVAPVALAAASIDAAAQLAE